MKKIITLTALLTIFTLSAYSNCVDILISKTLSAYKVLNSFEQPLDLKEIEKKFPPFSPLTILEKDALLGDEITVALKFSYKDKDYYLLKGENDNFAGNSYKQKHKIYKCCTIINDTMSYSGKNNLRITAEDGERRHLYNKDEVVREFKQKNRYYIQKDGKYGWCTSKTGVWKKENQKSNTTSPRISWSILESLNEKINATNETYLKYFGAFNKLGREQTDAPKWKVTEKGEVFRCKLSGDPFVKENLKTSTKLLCKDLKSLLIGTELSLKCLGNEITIKMNYLKK